MNVRPFTQEHIYEKQGSPKEKDKFSIHCLESYDRNIYIGTKDSVVQHLILQNKMNGDLDLGQTTREGRLRKLGSSSPVTQLRAIPVLNHLLVLWDRSVSALNMFSLEPISTLKKIQYVSSFEVCKSLLTGPSALTCVEMVTASSRRKVVRLHVVGVDRWECVREIAVPQDPVALALEGTCMCLATSDRYLLHDYTTGSTLDLFPHNHSRKNIIVTLAGSGEFLLNGPGSLGMFVMSTGICQRPPLQWPEEVMAARLCFPYVVALQAQALSVYSVLDQQLKQTVSLDGARGLISTSDGVLVFSERGIFSLSLVALERQIQSLIAHERPQEALVLLDGVQTQLPPDLYKDLHKTITCLAGFAQFYQEAFSEARDLFIKGEVDPREIISIYPGMEPCLGGLFHSQLSQGSTAKDLHRLQQEESTTFGHYLDFLCDFLQLVRGMDQGLGCSQEVDCTLLKLYVDQEDTENLTQLVGSPNSCRLGYCIPFLQQNKRFFASGLLYQSHGQHAEAIQTWVKIADGQYEDSSCSDVYGHIVRTLCQLTDTETMWAYSDWALQRNQEMGAQIFIRHHRGDLNTLVTENVLTFLKKYPLALQIYLEYLIYGLSSKEERHHSLLAIAYVTQTLLSLQRADDTGSDGQETREKLQQFLWDSSVYDTATVYERIKPTALHVEKAILLGKAGDHSQALQTLVFQEKDPQAAESYCHRAAQGLGTEFTQTLMLALLHIYLSSRDLTGTAVDLLNNNPQAFFAPEKVIQLLPESWSIQLVSHFLQGCLRGAFHQRRMGGVERALCKAELLRHKVIWAQVSKTMFRVERGQVCGACQKSLTEPQFVCSLRGELFHTSCSSHTE